MLTPAQSEGNSSLLVSSMTLAASMEVLVASSQCIQNGNQVHVLVLDAMETTNDDSIDSNMSNETGEIIVTAKIGFEPKFRIRKHIKRSNIMPYTRRLCCR